MTTTELNLDDVAERHEAYKLEHAHENAFACCSAHASADDVPDLLAEIKRLQDDNEMVREILGEEAAGLTSAWDAAKSWNARAETAEAEVKRLTETCTCGTPGVDYEGPQADCSVHGAIRGFAEASAEIKRLRDSLDSIATDFERASAEDLIHGHHGATYVHERGHGYAEVAHAIRVLLDGGES
jgi:hypothetical protein